jgi:hypothetical protein
LRISWCFSTYSWPRFPISARSSGDIW